MFLSCAQLWSKIGKMGKYPERKDQSPMQQTCDFCGRRFTQRQGDHRFCTPECKDDYWQLARVVGDEVLRQRQAKAQVQPMLESEETHV
jgi:hypothetical protein